MEIREPSIRFDVTRGDRENYEMNIKETFMSNLKRLLQTSDVGVLFYIKSDDPLSAHKLPPNPIMAKLVDGNIVFTTFPLPSYTFDSIEQAYAICDILFPETK